MVILANKISKEIFLSLCLFVTISLLEERIMKKLRVTSQHVGDDIRAPLRSLAPVS